MWHPAPRQANHSKQPQHAVATCKSWPYFLTFSSSAGTDCSCAGFVALGGANGGGKPTKQRKISTGRSA